MKQQCTPIDAKTFSYWSLFLAVTSKSIYHSFCFTTELRQYLQAFLPVVSNHLLPVLRLEIPQEQDLHKSYDSRKQLIICGFYRFFYDHPLVPDIELKYTADVTQTALDFIHGKDLPPKELGALRIALSRNYVSFKHREMSLVPKRSRLHWIFMNLERVEYCNMNHQIEHSLISEIVKHIEKL